MTKNCQWGLPMSHFRLCKFIDFILHILVIWLSVYFQLFLVAYWNFCGVLMFFPRSKYWRELFNFLFIGDLFLFEVAVEKGFWRYRNCRYDQAYLASKASMYDNAATFHLNILAIETPELGWHFFDTNFTAPNQSIKMTYTNWGKNQPSTVHVNPAASECFFFLRVKCTGERRYTTLISTLTWQLTWLAC